MSSKKPNISIIIPAYNEEKNLPFVLDDVFSSEYLKNISFEIIIVNDGSKDKTKDIASKYDVILVNHEKNYGKGKAIQSGIQIARGDIIVTMDADGSHKSSDFHTLIDPIMMNDMDAVIGSRFNSLEGKQSTTKFNLIGNFVFNSLIGLFNGVKISDSQTGYRAYKEKFIKKIDITTYSFGVETELTIKTIKRTKKWIEVPITCDPRLYGVSRLEPVKDGINILLTILKFELIMCYNLILST